MVKNFEVVGNYLYFQGTGKSAYGMVDSYMAKMKIDSQLLPDQVLFSREISNYRRSFQAFARVDSTTYVLGNHVVLELNADLQVEQPFTPGYFSERAYKISSTHNFSFSVVSTQPLLLLVSLVGPLGSKFSKSYFADPPGSYAVIDERGEIQVPLGKYPSSFYEEGYLSITTGSASAASVDGATIYLVYLGDDTVYAYNRKGELKKTFEYPASELIDTRLKLMPYDSIPKEATGARSISDIRKVLKKYTNNFISGFEVIDGVVHLLEVDKSIGQDGNYTFTNVYKRIDLKQRTYSEQVLPFSSASFLRMSATPDGVLYFIGEKEGRVLSLYTAQVDEF